MTNTPNPLYLALGGLLQDVRSFAQWAGGADARFDNLLPTGYETLIKTLADTQSLSAKTIELASKLAAAEDPVSPKSPQALVSVFSRLKIDKGTERNAYVPVRVLSLQQETFVPSKARCKHTIAIRFPMRTSASLYWMFIREGV